MNRIIIGIVLFFTLSSRGNSETGLITNIDNRESISLNGVWKYIVDPYETGYYDYRLEPFDQQKEINKAQAFFLAYQAKSPEERVEYDFEKSDHILVPGDWNSQKEKLFYYEGTIWYYRTFDYQPKSDHERQFLYFGAVNYEAEVYLNGQKLGKHIGGFTPFNFEVTGLLKPKGNKLVVKANNSRGKEKVPTVNTDWWNYGGITRDVKLVILPTTFIEDYYIQLTNNQHDSLEIKVLLNGSEKANQDITLQIPELNFVTSLKTNNAGEAYKRIKINKLIKWSPENPKLYEINLTGTRFNLSDKIGFRTIQTKGADILLNGKSVFLRGICIHEENGMRGGRAYSKEDAKMLLGWAKELGCNFVRLAHYPHNENMIRTADELGLLVWSEVPVYWTIQWNNLNTLANAKNQLTESITRDKNRASVIVWSMANETPVSHERTEFIKQMINTARSMDPVRFVSAALEKKEKDGAKNIFTIDDPLQEYVDIIAFNEYIGWYSGLPSTINENLFEINYNKPVVISEFGGDALQGFHGNPDERWTEEFQEYLFSETLKMLEKTPQFRGVTPWILADFRSPRRLLPDIQDGWNRKGLISQTGDKKKAFFVLKAYYQTKAVQYK